MVLGGVEIVYREGRILNLVQYSGDSNSCLLRGCGMDGLKLTIVIRNSPLLPVDKKTLNWSASGMGAPQNSTRARHMSPRHPQQWYIEPSWCCECA